MSGAGGIAVLTLLLIVYPPTRLPAQAPLPAPAAATHPVVPDSSKRVTPVGALWRSLLLPGWGQAVTGRHVVGAAFVTWEGVAIMMTVRAVQEEHYMEQTGSASLDAKRQQVQDWAVLWIFNHLFSAAEAYVSAHLQDFPKELKFRATPGGIGVSVPLP
jgi:hypothetical protein